MAKIKKFRVRIGTHVPWLCFCVEDVVGLSPRVNVDAQYDIPVGDAWCGNLPSCGYLCPRRFGIGLVILGI